MEWERNNQLICFLLFKALIFGKDVHTILLRENMEQEMATQSCILVWEILWTEEPAGLCLVAIIWDGGASEEMTRRQVSSLPFYLISRVAQWEKCIFSPYFLKRGGLWNVGHPMLTSQWRTRILHSCSSSLNIRRGGWGRPHFLYRQQNLGE